MKKTTPREFRNAFTAVMKAEQIEFRTALGFEPKSFSYFMRSLNFPKLAKHLGLLAWNKEYYSLEGMFYEQRGTDASGRYASFAKWMSVALEHAARPSRHGEEINKLQMYNAPLKVLITYAADGAETDTLLRGYESVIREADVLEDVATVRQQLVIVGTPKTAREWHFYVYENGGFVLMLPG